MQSPSVKVQPVRIADMATTCFEMGAKLHALDRASVQVGLQVFTDGELDRRVTILEKAAKVFDLINADKNLMAAVRKAVVERSKLEAEIAERASQI